MLPADLPEDKALLKTVLAPLLDDFLYWFERSLEALNKHELPFMAEGQQQDLIERVQTAQAEVGAAKSLFEATDGAVAIDMKAVLPWHQLVQECWGVAQKRRQYEASQE